MRGILAHAGVLLVFLLLMGCSGESERTPEAQVRAYLDAAEIALEHRSLSEVSRLISPAYSDSEGRDHRAMKRLLMGYFLRHKTIHILKQVQEITLLDDNVARVVLYAGVAGNRPQTEDALTHWRGDLIRLEAEVISRDDEWRLESASWRQASRGDLFH